MADAQRRPRGVGHHLADGPLSETWAILCSHRLDPGVPQHSVNPCLPETITDSAETRKDQLSCPWPRDSPHLAMSDPHSGP
jgi:hypothetical protein